jgi:hypothetical protein
VPPGVSQFHVAYEPRSTANKGNNNGNNNGNMIQQPMPVTNNNNGQKLILVRVPPNTAPGTTLHVEVPDEPGRILAAVVPPNASEFQVAYQPRTSANANANAQSSARPQTGYDVRDNSSRGMMSNALVPMIGGAAMGAAGMGMYDHYHHQPYYGDGGYGTGAYDYGGADAGAYGYDGAADYGGGDYGGDYSGYDGGF